MSSELNLLENNEAALVITVVKDVFDKGMDAAYQKNKHVFNLPGFRKGKVPRHMVETHFGKESLYEDAIDFVFSDAYNRALETHELDVVSRPDLNHFDVNEEGNLILEITVITKPTVHIANYKNLTYEHREETVSPDEIEKELEREQEQNARILTLEADQPIEENHIAVIDFTGYVDGEAFAGGDGNDFELIIGSKSFIEGFEEQLIGAITGEDVEVNVTFPTEYHAEDLAGKDAVFEVTIKEVKQKEFPLLDDEFAQDISEFETMDELKANIEKDLLESKKADNVRENENQVMEKLIDLLEADIPSIMINNQLDNIINDFSQRLQGQGMDLKLYLQYLGQDIDGFREGHRETAEKNVKLRLSLEAVALAEAFEISETELDEEIERTAEMYQMETDQLKPMLHEKDLNQIKEDMKVQKSIDFVMSHAIPVEPVKKEEIDAEIKPDSENNK